MLSFPGNFDKLTNLLSTLNLNFSMIGISETWLKETREALEKMERSLKMVTENAHYQVALPWGTDPPYLPNNWSMVERRAALLRKHLLRDQDLSSKYNTTMNEYIEHGHTERVPTNELRVVDRPLLLFTPPPGDAPLRA